jgi:signal transduction histidine kinase
MNARVFDRFGVWLGNREKRRRTVATSVVSEPGPQVEAPPSPESAKASSRESLVVPVIFIISLSVLTACGLVWITAETMNKNAQTTSQHLASSMLRDRTSALQRLAIDYAWWDRPAQGSRQRFNETWIAQRFSRGLAANRTLSSAMVIGPSDWPIVAFADGRRTDNDAFQAVPKSLRALVGRARRTAFDQSRAVADLIRMAGEVHLVAAAPLPGLDPALGQRPPARRSVLVLTRAIDSGMLAEIGTAFPFGGLSIFFEEPPSAYFALPLRGDDGGLVGHLAWRNPRVGDVLLWWLLPSLACALIAITYMLHQFFHSADLVIERESHLVSSIQRERELRDLKSRFVSMVSHELRTPLSTIRSAADLLERYEDRMTADDRRRELWAIRDAVVGLNRMMEEVMALGRSDAVLEANNARLNLGVFCRELWDETVQAHGGKHRLVLTGLAVKRNVVTDDTLLRAVLSNLFQNAIKYSPGGEQVGVEIAERKGDCTIKVIDHGRGIAAEERDKIFEAFHRGTSSKSTNGTGLGLAVAKAAAERLGGHINVESEPGEGTTFEFVLPGLLQSSSPLRRKEEL